MNPALANLIRPHYHTLKGYVSAGMESDKTANLIFMNANENPYELPGLEGFNRYPEPQPKVLLQTYADTYSVNPDNIVATRGADEAIVILTKLFCEPGEDNILTCPPTFGMYPVNANTMPAGVIEIPLIKSENDFALDVETIIGTKTKLIFICSPNNPTGNSFPREDIAKICRQTEGKSVIILDETYIEFANASSLTDILNDHPNLIILRTLSKSYSMAGMRMGCLIAGDTDLIALMRTKCLDAYPLPKQSVAAALTALTPDNQKQAAANREKLITERKRMETELAKNKLIKTIYKSDANYLLIEMTRAKDFIEYCKTKSLILRDFTDKPATPNTLRLSIGTPEQNNLVLELLKEFITTN